MKFRIAFQEKPVLFFFYVPNSDEGRNMEYKLNSLDMNNGQHIPIYAIDLDKEPTIADKYNVSVAPCILLFKDGHEHRRIMGVVPTYNLKMISERDIK